MKVCLLLSLVCATAGLALAKRQVDDSRRIPPLPPIPPEPRYEYTWSV